jgi:hypothetical protein
MQQSLLKTQFQSSLEPGRSGLKRKAHETPRRIRQASSSHRSRKYQVIHVCRNPIVSRLRQCDLNSKPPWLPMPLTTTVSLIKNREKYSNDPSQSSEVQTPSHFPREASAAKCQPSLPLQ